MTEKSQNITKAVVKKLHSLITEGDEVDRCYAIRTLQTIQNTDSTKLLINAMRDDDIDVCIDAIEVLGNLGGDSVAEKLTESLINDPDGEIKVACVRALAELGDTKAITELLKLAEKPPEESSYETGDWDLWWDMQLASVRGLGKMQAVEAIPVLKRILKDDDCLDIESEIFNALAQIGSTKKGKEASEYLLDRLNTGNPRTRRRIAKSLGKNSSVSTVKPLARCLQDKDASVREITLLALQERNATQYLPAILLTFRDPNSTVRKTAIQVAHQFSRQLQQHDSSDTDLLTKLLPLLKDPDQTVKSAVLNTLISLDWKANEQDREYLSTLLRECSGDCFASACRAVEAQQKLTGNTDGVATLLYMFRHKELKSAEDEIHALTTIGRSKQWNTVIESILAANIFNNEKMVRLAALEALSELDKSFPQGANIEGMESDSRLPLDMISEALQGNLKPPLTQKIIPIVPVEDVTEKFNEEEIQETNNVKKEIEAKKDSHSCTETSLLDNALEQINKSIADGETPHPLSTLDAIAISSVEKQLDADSRKEPEETLNDAKDKESEDKEFQEFLALSEENKEISKWLFNKGTGDVSADIQRLAARMLGKSTAKDVFTTLLLAFKEDETGHGDNELKREAALSISALIQKGITPEEDLKNTLHQALLKELNSPERDLRIAIARALAVFGDADDISYLKEKLDDKSPAMRAQTVYSISEIAMRSKSNLDYKKLAELMLSQLNNLTNDDKGVHRAVVDSLIPLFKNKLNGSAASLKEATIDSLIKAGLSGSNGQVKEMSWGLNALDKELSSTRLLEKIDEVSTSTERRYLVEMLGELQKPNKFTMENNV